MQRCSLTMTTAPNRNPLAYPLEVLKGDTQAVCLRGGYDAFRDVVVYPRPDASLFAPSLLQQPFSSASALSLQPGSQAPLAVTQTTQLCTAVDSAAAVYGDIDHAQIYSRVVGRRSKRLLRDVTCGEQIPRAVTVEQVGLTQARAQQRPVALVGHKRDELATADGPDRDTTLMPGEDAIIVCDAAEGTETAWGLAGLAGLAGVVVQFIGVGDLGDDTHHELSRQAELGTSRSIDELMQIELLEGARIPGGLADEVGRSIGTLQGSAQDLSLQWRRLQLELGNQLHRSIIALPFYYKEKEVEALLPIAKGRGLRAFNHR